MLCFTARTSLKPKRTRTKLQTNTALLTSMDMMIRQSSPDREQWASKSSNRCLMSILRIVEMEKGVVEGAAATPLAACLSGQLKQFTDKKCVLLLCGGNIDPNVLSRVIERGLVGDGRLSRFIAVISDRPGGLADLTTQIAASGASIKQVVHDRAFAGSDVSAVHVLCTVETRNREHLAMLRKKLREHGVETYDSR